MQQQHNNNRQNLDRIQDTKVFMKQRLSQYLLWNPNQPYTVILVYFITSIIDNFKKLRITLRGEWGKLESGARWEITLSST